MLYTKKSKPVGLIPKCLMQLLLLLLLLLLIMMMMMMMTNILGYLHTWSTTPLTHSQHNTRHSKTHANMCMQSHLHRNSAEHPTCVACTCNTVTEAASM